LIASFRAIVSLCPRRCFTVRHRDESDRRAERMLALNGHANVTIVPTDETDMRKYPPMRLICSNMAVASLLSIRSLISMAIGNKAHVSRREATRTRGKQDPTELGEGKQIYHRSIGFRSLAEGSL
jgi:hypothetical protein